MATLLREAGIEDAAAFPRGATIRLAPAIGDEDTIAAPQMAAARPLPRISVDLRTGDATSACRAAPAPDLQVVHVIGEGGMGRVLLARQHSLRRDVAVKTAKDGAPASALGAIRLEAEFTGQLEHPAIVPVHALGVDDAGRPLMVMKRIEGVGWDVLLHEPSHAAWDAWPSQGRDRLTDHLHILMQIANALHFAHSRGIVHRDVKPENVLIGQYGDVYLADWGIATRAGSTDGRLCGTPAYLAPEMAGGGVIDARTDVYLLGATLHEVLTSSPRHDASSAAGALVAALRSEPYTYPDDVPVELQALANAACHVEPGARPASAKGFRDRLADYLAHRESVAIGQRALGRLERLESLSAVSDPSAEQRRELDKLVVEARFGLEQALAAWDGNAGARAGLERLDGLLDARNARSAELERQARDQDPSMHARERALATSLLGAFGIADAIFALTVLDEPTPTILIIAPLLAACVLLAAAALMRGSVLATALNRRAFTALLIGIFAMLLGRVAGVLMGIDPAAHFARDAMVLATMLAVTAIFSLRWLLAPAAAFAAGAVAALLDPASAMRSFVLAESAAMVLSSGLAWYTLRDPAPARPD